MSVTTTVEQSERRRAEPVMTDIVDCDVHTALASAAALKPHLATRWHAYFDQIPGRGQGGIMIGARPSAGPFRDDARPPDGGMPGSDLGMLREQLLDRWPIRRAILSPLEPLGWPQYGEHSQAFHAALNDWTAAEWLDRDDRLYGSIVIPMDDGARAAEEVLRVAADPRFVQVFMIAGARDPIGHPKYWPIYEAAVAHGLPITLHVGGFSGSTTASGWASYYLERHIGWSAYYPPHVVSLVYSGVFDRFPDLKIVLQEGGMAWMPPLMWRLDRSWKQMRAEAPHLTEAPSEIIRRHIWFSTQPIDEPEKPHYLPQLLEQLDMDDRIMFASDYPHWDFDPPDRVIPTSLDAELRRKIFSANAELLYSFPR